MASSSGYDGNLADWAEVNSECDWKGLVLGNGLSINLWEKFDYDSLYEEATSHGLLGKDDAQLFDDLGATNFETVLGALSMSITVGKALGETRPVDRQRHASVRDALARAVHRVHIEWADIPDETLEIVQKELRKYRFTFTTSYDLIINWAINHGDGAGQFLDFFWAGSNTDAFDESTHTFSQADSRTRLHFLHGALHLVEHEDGSTCKRHATMRTLLEQFGSAHGDDPAARPLIVTEADARQKERSIADNDYLSYCWRTLRECDAPLVLFGHSLSAQDSHLIEALNEYPERPLAVALRPKRARRNKSEKYRIASLLPEAQLHFFDSTTYQLGDESLRVKTAPRWSLKRGLRPAA